MMALSFGVSEIDLENFEVFAKRLVDMTVYANERNCVFYVDAEQTYMQRAIDSFAMQLTHRFNRGERAIIMNGFQNYLKRH